VSNIVISREVHIQVSDDSSTVGDYFQLSKTRKRGIYDSRLDALILHHAPGGQYRGVIDPVAEEDSEDQSECCGRCKSDSFQKPFKSCMQLYRGDELLQEGVCSNCLAAAAAERCSYRRKFSELLSVLPALGIS
jgi:hypothetical protein